MGQPTTAADLEGWTVEDVEAVGFAAYARIAYGVFDGAITITVDDGNVTVGPARIAA